MRYFELNPLKRTMIAVLAALTVSAFIIPEAQAQLPNLLSSGKRSKRTVNTPTTITAITMDFDIENNEATLLGDVVVDDPDIKIECNRMKIFLEDKKADDKKADQKDSQKTASKDQKSALTEQKAAAEKKAAEVIEKTVVSTTSSDAGKTAAAAGKKAQTDDKKTASDTEDDSSNGGKQLVKIECVGDVIITRKPAEGEDQDQEQRATAGKAVYYFKDSIIELLDKPVVYADNKKITGRAITINLEQGGRMKLTLGKIEDYTETPLLDMGK